MCICVCVCGGGVGLTSIECNFAYVKYNSECVATDVYHVRSKQVRSSKAMKLMWHMCGCVWKRVVTTYEMFAPLGLFL